MQQSLLRSVTDLIEEGAQKDSIPPGLEQDVWAILTLAATHAATWQDEGQAIDSFDRLLGAALNHTTSRALEAALQVALWSYRVREKGEAVPDGGRTAAQHLTPILDRVLRWSGTVRVLAEAVIGRFLPWLQLVVPRWVNDHVGQLLDLGATQPLEHPAWGAYLTRGRLYDSTFRALRPWYVKAADLAALPAGRSTSEEREWSLTRSLAENVLIAVLRGLAAVGDPDDLVEKTFTNVPAPERGGAYWAIFRGWSDAEHAPPDTFIERLVAFWEWRLDQLERSQDEADVVTEARELGWFLRTPHLPDEHVLRLGLRTARAAKGQLQLYADWDRLRALAAAEVDVAYEIAELILHAELSKQQHSVPVDEVKAMLQVVLKTGSPATKSRARRLVNRLGELGYGDFGDLLE